MLISDAEFEQILNSVDRLSSEQRKILRAKLNETWATQFGNAVDSIRSRIPAGITDEEMQDDIERAIREVRGLPEE